MTKRRTCIAAVGAGVFASMYERVAGVQTTVLIVMIVVLLICWHTVGRPLDYSTPYLPCVRTYS